MADTAATGRRPSLTQKITATLLLLLLLLVWAMGANSWTEKGCHLSQGYIYVLSHGGGPDSHQGCDPEPGGPVYTDQYYG
ncbi:hypothetical protein ABZZ47_31925 [Streptomyces sp. NPDC006465]|uniref:hypothetical protein n=1 Tax=Streptomyces sp. NPDC006465 TaxID=3157174 RepID=UPI00339F8F18